METEYSSPEMLVYLSLLWKSTEEAFCYLLNATTYKWWLIHVLHGAGVFNTPFLKVQNQNWSEINAVLAQLNLICRKRRIISYNFYLFLAKFVCLTVTPTNFSTSFISKQSLAFSSLFFLPWMFEWILSLSGTLISRHISKESFSSFS